MAAGTALWFAHRQKKVLVFTTDPAPSLGSIFEQDVGSRPTAIQSVKNLFAMEINARQALAEFKEEYGASLLDILQEGTYLADEETEELLSLEIPGLDEVMGLKKITEYMESHEYDVYIVDTAPSGHTLRLLALPQLLDEWIKFLAQLRVKYHTMVRQFSGRDREEQGDRFLIEMKKVVKKVRGTLTNARETEFVVVTIPEALAVSETEILLKELQKLQIITHHILINNIVPHNSCNFCRSRRMSQEIYIQHIKKTMNDFSIIEIPLQPQEVKGVALLQELLQSAFS